MPNTSSETNAADSFEIIQSWEPKKEVWAFRYGPSVLSVGTLVSAIYINGFVRKKLKMKTYAFMTTYMATCMPPGAMSPVLHGIFVVEPHLSGSVSCPICLETRSALIQVGVGLLYPLILAPVATAQFATRYMTAHVPGITEPKEFFTFMMKLFKPAKTKLLGLFALQVLLGVGMTHWEHNTIYNVVDKIKQMEDAIKRNSPERLQELKEKSENNDNSIHLIARSPTYALDSD